MPAPTADPLSSLMSAVPLPLVLIGPDERLLRLNSQAQEMFGTGMDGRHFIALLRQPELIEAVGKVFAHGTTEETRFREANRMHETLYRAICSPTELETGRGVLVSFADVTSIETAGQMRRDFVANVSHELRTPLTAIIGFIETLRGPARDDVDARERFLGTMSLEAERMNRLVRDLLSLSRVEAEERVRPTRIQDVRDLVQSVCRSLRPLAEAAGVRLDITVPKGETIVACDADQLMQVFTNLIENAVKYGGDGGVVDIAVAEVTRDPVLRQAAIDVRVRDFGAGIDSIHLHRLTERFYRADSHRSREVGGTGLGLAIVKHILNRHRGHLKIQSRPGEGSTFTAVLPSAPANQNHERQI